jgi:hypothetical protein
MILPEKRLVLTEESGRGGDLWESKRSIYSQNDGTSALWVRDREAVHMVNAN